MTVMACAGSAVAVIRGLTSDKEHVLWRGGDVVTMPSFQATLPQRFAYLRDSMRMWGTMVLQR